MVFINMEMPERCVDCNIHCFGSCILLKDGHIKDIYEKNPNCPLMSIESLFKILNK